MARKRVRLERGARVRLEQFDYWTLMGSNVVFTAPKGYSPMNPSCVMIDESKFEFYKSKGYTALRLLRSDHREPAGHWWLA